MDIILFRITNFWCIAIKKNSIIRKFALLWNDTYPAFYDLWFALSNLGLRNYVIEYVLGALQLKICVNRKFESKLFKTFYVCSVHDIAVLP